MFCPMSQVLKYFWDLASLEEVGGLQSRFVLSRDLSYAQQSMRIVV